MKLGLHSEAMISGSNADFLFYTQSDCIVIVTITTVQISGVYSSTPPPPPPISPQSK